MSADDTNAEDEAKRWRSLEAEALALARGMTDLEPKRIMLSIAEAYRRLAERALSRRRNNLQ
jgi:hypothetical protein